MCRCSKYSSEICVERDLQRPWRENVQEENCSKNVSDLMEAVMICDEWRKTMQEKTVVRVVNRNVIRTGSSYSMLARRQKGMMV